VEVEGGDQGRILSQMADAGAVIKLPQSRKFRKPAAMTASFIRSSNSQYEACPRRPADGICRLNPKSRLSDWESTPEGVFHLQPGGL
jgi:hypothetical protein